MDIVGIYFNWPHFLVSYSPLVPGKPGFRRSAVWRRFRRFNFGCVLDDLRGDSL